MQSFEFRHFICNLFLPWILIACWQPLALRADDWVILSDELDRETDKVKAHNTGKKIVFNSGDRPILEFNYQKVSPPKGIDKLYARSGYIHPLYTPSGRIVTDDFSDDHAHQHGLFHAFVKASFDGETLDFWNQHRRTGNVKCDGIRIDPNVPSRLTTVQTHYRLSDSKPIFAETWTIDVSTQKDFFVIDLKIEINNVSGKKVVIEKNHYGSFGLRGSGQWRKAKESGFDFATSSMKNRKNGNLSREKWVAMTGKVDGKPCGVAVLAHPGNFRYPQPARLHPTMPYFSFAPMNLGAFDIPNEKGVTSRFRIVTFDGKLDREKINALNFK